MKKSDIETFYGRLAAHMPEPRGELNYVNPYTLLVAVVLSAQATDVGVNKATRALFKTVTTPQQMLALGEAGLKAHIKTIGLYNAKAKNVIALSQLLIAEHGGEVTAEDVGRDQLFEILMRYPQGVEIAQLEPTAPDAAPARGEPWAGPLGPETQASGEVWFTARHQIGVTVDEDERNALIRVFNYRHIL